MINLEGKRLLFISAHMDDIEFGCGATISSMAEKSEIKVLALSANRKSYHGEIQEVRDPAEQVRAMEALGLNASQLEYNEEICGQLLPEYRQLVLEEMYRLKSEFKPDAVFVPTLNDVHQDHRTASSSALKAFKRESIFGYEVINSTYGYDPKVFHPVSSVDVEKKAKAISCFESQYNGLNTTSDYFSQELIFSLARVRGARCGNEFAEAFELYNLVI